MEARRDAESCLASAEAGVDDVDAFDVLAAGPAATVGFRLASKSAPERACSTAMRGICSSSEEEDMWTSGHRVRLTAVVDSREGPRIKSFNAVLFEGGGEGRRCGQTKG